MGNKCLENENTCLKIVNKSEQKISGRFSSDKNNVQDGFQNYRSKILFVFWNKDNQDNIIIGTKTLECKFNKFMYDYQNGIYHQVKNQSYFLENLIAIQDGKKVENKITLNDALQNFQTKETPQELLLGLLGENIIFEKNICHLELNNKSQSQISSNQDSYVHCYQNFQEQSQLIFEELSKKTLQLYDWNTQQIQKTQDKFLYKNAIILKVPLQDQHQIRERCQRWKTLQEFLENEKL